MSRHRGDLRRGDLCWVDWSPGRRSEQAGLRPALVVQADAANRNENYPNTVVAAVSRSGRDVPSHVRLEPTPENGLRTTSDVKCEQLQTISKERLADPIGRLGPDDMRRVSAALKRMMDLT